MQPIVLLCGPTASGKTAAALELAEKIGAEIISSDSGQIYRGLNIGTAKPLPIEQKQVRFHLIDILNPDQAFSAAEFRSQAADAIADIQSRGKRVVIAGGTGLYFKALEQGLFEGPSKNEAVRAELERKIDVEGVESLHQELKAVDPEAAKTIPSKNRQRLIRALEVYRVTGRPISDFWKEHRRKLSHDASYSFLKYGLDLPKDELNRRIEERVEGMIEQGLLAEVRGLLKQWGPVAPGLRIIGYKEIVDYLLEKTTLDEAMDLVIKNTRNYAKRQRTWFRKDQEIRWVSGVTKIMQDLTKE